MRTIKAFTYLAVATVFSAPSHAFQLKFEDEHWSSSLDTAITYGAQWRLNDQSHQLLKDWQRDDSNRNWDKGLVSNSIRFLTEFEIAYSKDNGDRFGLFTRAAGYYDDEVANTNTDYSTSIVSGSNVAGNNGVAPDTLMDTMNSSTTYGGSTRPGKFNSQTVDRIGRGAEFLDFFVYAQLFSESDHPVSLRIGKQVISWGESAFIQTGISSVMNSADVNKAVQPGVEVKEILRPLGAIYGTVLLTDNVTFQAYYQYDWDHIITPAYGAYLNGAPDFINTDGGERLMIPADLLAELLYFRGPPAGPMDEALLSNSHFAAERLADDDASDDGQWGVAFNWYVPELNDTEFGFYFLNYHRKLPDLIMRNFGGTGEATSFSGVPNAFGGTPDWSYDDYNATGGGGGNNFQECLSIKGPPVPGNDCFTLGLVGDGLDVASFNAKYYEDVKLYGFSWATVLPVTDTAFSGEIALHHDIPVQTLQAFQGLLEDAVLACIPNPGVPNTGIRCENELSTRENVVVTQLFFFHDFDNLTFADDVGLLMEIGWIHAVDLNDGKLITPFAFDDGTADGHDDSGVVAAGYFDSGDSPAPAAGEGLPNTNGAVGPQPPTFFPFSGFSSQIPAGAAPGFDNRQTVWNGNSPASKNSYGYQMVWSATWYDGLGKHIDALTGTDLIATFAFRHDFKGTSVIPGAGFTEGHKAGTLGLEATWQNTWSAKLSYTNFFGHSTDTLGKHISQVPLDDRDFVSLAVKYRF